MKAVSNIRTVLHQKHCQVPDTISPKTVSKKAVLHQQQWLMYVVVFHQRQCQFTEQCIMKSNVKYYTPCLQPLCLHQEHCQIQNIISAKCLSNAMSNVRAVFHQEHCQIQDTLSAWCFIKDSVKCQQCFNKSNAKYRTPCLLSILSKAMSNVRAVFHQEHCQIQDTLSAKCFIKDSVKCQSSVSPRALSNTRHYTC